MRVVHYEFDTLPSTRSWARMNCHTFDKDSLNVVTAKYQTAGVGKFGRKWVSERDTNLLTTVVLFLPTIEEKTGNLQIVWGISVIKALQTLGVSPRFKWPNDLYIEERKLGGLLCDTALVDGLIFCSLSLGLNVNMTLKEAASLDQPATSLFIETGALQNTEEVLNSILDKFIADLSLFQRQGFLPFASTFNALISFKKGQSLRFNDYQKVWTGQFHSVDKDGAIHIELPTGEIRRFSSGEILP